MLDPYVEKILKDNERKRSQRFMTLKMPCCGALQQITQAKDQYVACRRCHKSLLLTWGYTKKVSFDGRR